MIDNMQQFERTFNRMVGLGLYIKPGAAGKLCGVTSQTIYNRLRAGEIRGLWLAGRWWVWHADVYRSTWRNILTGWRLLRLMPIHKLHQLAAAFNEDVVAGEWVTTGDAGRILGVSAERAIPYRIRNGVLAAINLGGVWWVSIRSVYEAKARQDAAGSKYLRAGQGLAE